MLPGLEDFPKEPTTQEELYRQLEEQRKTEEFNKNLLRATLKNPSVKEVLRLQHMGYSPAIWGNIFELIQKDMNGKLSTLITEQQKTRFERFINHSYVFGIRSRHSVSEHEPPRNPMSEGKAKYFIDELVRRWITLVAQTL